MTEPAGGEVCLPQRPRQQVGASRRRRIKEIIQSLNESAET